MTGALNGSSRSRGLPTGGLEVDIEAIAMQRRLRWNPIQNLSAKSLTSALNGWEYGDLRSFYLLAEAMAKRDDTIACVKPKREKAIARRPWQVLTVDDSREAKRHKAALEYAYNNLTAVNAFDRNERGGFSRLVRQMMTAVSFQYAAHHIVWQPSAEGLSATFEFVPLNFFENRTGTLRFIRDGLGIEGTPLADREWMITVGDGLMVPCSVGYFAKRATVNDWLTFSEKFGMPGVVGRTRSAKGSEAGDAMRTAVEEFGNDWSACIYGDDGESKIELIEAKGGNNLPFPALAERIDRKLAALYRGADLSTVSSGKGEGTGASLQGDEGDLLEQDDAQTITEALNHYVDRVVLWHQFGVERGLAYVQVAIPEKKDLTASLESMKTLVSFGAPISVASAMERFGWSPAKAGEDLLTPVAAPAVEGNPDSPEPEDPAANALAAHAMEGFVRRAKLLLGNTHARAMQELSTRLTLALNGPDEQFADELRSIAEAIPQILIRHGSDPETVSAFERVFAGAFFTGATEGRSAANARDYSRDANGRFAPTRAYGSDYAKDLSPEQQRASIDAALQAATEGRQESFSLGKISPQTAARIKTSTGMDVSGHEVRIDSDFVIHARNYHSNLTDDDFRSIPSILDGADTIESSTTKRGRPAALFRKRSESRDYLAVAAHQTGKGQLGMVTLKKSKVLRSEEA